MLDSIEIKNFRSCEHVQLRLDQPVIALLGKNGAGKTNLLHAIQLVADLCVGEAEPAMSLNYRHPSEPTSFTLKFTIGSHAYHYWYEIRRSGESANRKGFAESLTKDGILLFRRDGEEVSTRFMPVPLQSGLFRLSARMASLPALLQIFPESHEATAELKPVAEYLSAVRFYSLIPGFQEHFVGPQRAFVGDQWSDSSPFIEVGRYEAWKAQLSQGRARRSVQLRLLHLYLTDRPSFDELKILIGESGLGLLSDIRVETVHVPRPPRQQTVTSDSGDDVPELVYTLGFVPGDGLAGAGREFRYSGLSMGTWRILQMLTYLIFDKNSCMLLEQPEDSIHPGLLAKVIDILRTYSGRTQLICTTHSPRVMNLVGPDGIRLVTSEGGSTIAEALSDADLDAATGYMHDEGTLAEYLDTL